MIRRTLLLAQRLRYMQRGEALFRIRRAICRAAANTGNRIDRKAIRTIQSVCETSTGFGALPALAFKGASAANIFPPSLHEEAQALADGRVTVFGGASVDVSAAPWDSDLWGRADVSHLLTPPETRSDVRAVWELNRHAHFVRLGQAWSATRDERFALQFANQISEWIDQCKPRTSVPWRSALECGLRLVNWCLALELFRDYPDFPSELPARVYKSIYAQAVHTSQNYSLYSSAGNHLIGEAAGIFVAMSYLPWLPAAQRLEAEAKQHLEAQVPRQILTDGAPLEQSPSYLCLVLQLASLCVLIGNRRKTSFIPAMHERLREGCTYLLALQCEGKLPLIGDGDDSVIPRLGPQSAPPLGEVFGLSAAALGSGRSPVSLRAAAAMVAKTLDCEPDWEDAPAASHLFSNGGLLVYRDDRVHLIVDCGPLGMPPMAGHGHADGLGIWLAIHGTPVLIDPGTYCYVDESFRHLFKSTAYHNTLSFNSHDQATYAGQFAWRDLPSTEIVDCDPEKGEFEGRITWSNGAIHERRITMETQSAMQIHDRWRGPTAASIHFALSPEYRVRVSGPNTAEASGPGPAIQFSCDIRPTIRELWASDGFYRRVPIKQVAFQTSSREGNNTIRIAWTKP